MLLSYGCHTSEEYHLVKDNIEQFRQYIEMQRGFISQNLRLVILERPQSELCHVILYSPFEVMVKLNPYFLLKNILKQIGLDDELLIEEISLGDLSEYHTLTSSVIHVDSLEDLMNNDFERFAMKTLREPIEETSLYIDDTYEEMLREELLRIKSYSKDHFSGNPCHYLFTSDSSESLDASDYLVNTLVQSHRLHSSRILDVEFGFGGAWQLFRYKLTDSLPYCLGRVVRVTFSESFEKESVRNKRKILDKLVEYIDEFGNTVLFIIHFNDKLYDESSMFLKKDVANLYIEFSNNELSVEEAKEYIRQESLKYGADPNEVIEEVISLSENKKYSRNEIKTQLIVLSKNKLYQPHFEPYLDLMNKKLESFDKNFKQEHHSQKAMDALEQLIGLDKVKAFIKDMVLMNKLRPKLREKGISLGQSSMHCCFMGHPGTAKTTVARLLAQIMKDEGILKTGVFVEVTRKDLIGQYIGHTAPKVKEAFERARGGVLFIDEAYALNDGYTHKSYGDEAIATLVELIENHRHDTIVILAGYPKEMNEFLSVNPGLHGRIPHILNFNNYSVSEMLEIAKHMAKSKGFTFEDETQHLLEKQIQVMRQHASFANGRTVRNLVESVIQKHILLTYSESQEPSDELLLTVNAMSVEGIQFSLENHQYRKVQYH